MGSRSQVNAEDDSDNDILANSKPIAGTDMNKGITVRRSIELSEVDATGKEVSSEKSFYNAR